MTTITLEKSVELKKTKFVDIDDLYQYILSQYIDLDFHELKNNEISANLLKKINLSKDKPMNSFLDI